MAGVKIKMASASTPSVNEQTRPHFSPHRKAKAKRPKLVSSDISHVMFASVILGENPSEEVDDYDNYYYYYWASEASPTLGCSIEISRDIYSTMSVIRTQWDQRVSR